MEKSELKIQALLEKISQLTTQYENQAADYRVDITLLSLERDELRKQLNEINEQRAAAVPTEVPEVVQGETVETDYSGMDAD